LWEAIYPAPGKCEHSASRRDQMMAYLSSADQPHAFRACGLAAGIAATSRRATEEITSCNRSANDRVSALPYRAATQNRLTSSHPHCRWPYVLLVSRESFRHYRIRGTLLAYAGSLIMGFLIGSFSNSASGTGAFGLEDRRFGTSFNTLNFSSRPKFPLDC